MSETQFNDAVRWAGELGPADDGEVGLLWAAERIKELEAKLPRWVPCSERLPDAPCWCYCECGNMDEWQGEFTLEAANAWGITHWMPLPEPPTGEEVG